MSGIGPRDELEGLLVTQMVAVHVSGMRSLARATQASNPLLANMYHGQVTRLFRLFATQMEALDRHERAARAATREQKARGTHAELLKNH